MSDVPGLREFRPRVWLIRAGVVAAAIGVFVGVSLVHGLAGALVGVVELAAGIGWLMKKAAGARDEVEGPGPRRSWLNPF
jgi:hypothetical protein